MRSAPGASRPPTPPSCPTATRSDTPSPTRLWRAADGGHAYLNEKALRGLAGPRAVVTLRALARSLQERGWEIGATGDEHRPHLMATNGWIDLDVRSGAEGLGRVPVVVACGDHDLLTPIKHARRLARTIEDARLVTLGGAGHMVPFEENVAVTRIIEDLLDRIGHPVREGDR